MRRLPHVLLACALAALAVVPVASAGSLGFSADDGFRAVTADASATTTELNALRASWARVDVRWNTIAATQPTNARLPGNAAYTWTSVDQQFAAIAAAKLTGRTPEALQVLVSIGGTPDWARSDGGRGGSPGDPAWAPRRAAFQNFVAAVVTRYGARASAFEIWPDPNVQSGLRPQRMAGRLVAPGLLRMLTKVATTEIRKSSTAPIVTGGLARTDPASTVDTPSITFLRAMARTRIQADAIGMRLDPPGGVEAAPDPTNLWLGDPGTIIANVDAYFPNQGKGIWATGYGASLSATDATPVTTFLNAALNPRFGVSIWDNLVDTAAAPTNGLYAAPTPPAAFDAPKAGQAAWVAAVATLP
ncbi:MAG: hypothetical protein ACR2JV_08625 [Gaiellales bacterium]